MTRDVPFYESLVASVRKRDGNKCTEPRCTRVKFLGVVRVDPWKADSLKNLRTVCKAHRPDWE